jgi:succinate-semialdehyde dehydrogenase/glutarate-semialdehyde dehydrogenase
VTVRVDSPLHGFTHADLVSPIDGRPRGRLRFATAATIERTLAASARAARPWARWPVEARAAILLRAATEFEARAEDLARTVTAEMGKVLTEARAEVAACAAFCRHAAVRGPEALAPQDVITASGRHTVECAPLGPVLLVMPWNFPLWQTVRAAVPALLAGNSVVLKPSPLVPESAAALQHLWHAAGLPRGTFAVLHAPVSSVASLIGDPRIRSVAFTGGTAAGRRVAAAAGRHLKPATMELGGSDPWLILHDADLGAAAAQCAAARLRNNGQCCLAPKRVLVDVRVQRAFLTALGEAVGAARWGNPFDASFTQGPLAHRDYRDEVARQVERARRAGAEVPIGGRAPEGPGAYFPPTIVTGARPGMAVFDQEVFGPVFAVATFRTQAAAVRLANATAFGLGAAVFSADEEQARRLLRDEIVSGCGAVNGGFRSDPALPFGGVKDSGYGRELGDPGWRAHVNLRSLTLAPRPFAAGLDRVAQ